MNFTKIPKIRKLFVLFGLICAETITFSFGSYAQDVEAKIKLLPPSHVLVEGRFLNKSLAGNNLSFLETYADVSNLGLRIENLKLFDEKGNEIVFKKVGSAEFQTNQTPTSWKYEMKSEVSQTLTDAAHVSWISESEGLLMPGDLLPRLSSNNKGIAARITFELPENWKVATRETPRTGENVFDVQNVENSLFFVGKNWREKTIQIEKTNLSFVTSGEWAFSDEESAEMISLIFPEHRKVFGEIPSSKTQIILLPFPQSNASADRWRAETRGSTVTIISGVIPQKNVALQRLHEQLRHEIFHLWLPNAVSLSGNYAWFYEGFTIYQALRTGVQLNQIRFEDYLNTVSRAYDIAQKDTKGQSLSLVEASQTRWTGSNNFVYAKGLLAAFLCDVALLRESKGKRSLKDIFRMVYQKHRAPAEIQDGNTAILSILKSYPELIAIVRDYIESKSGIGWKEYLESAGIEFKPNTSATQLKIKENLNGRQKDLLDDLGYNQWRKILQKKK